MAAGRSAGRRPPPGRARTALRVVAVGAGYAAYLALEPPVLPALLVWAGTVLGGWGVIDLVTGERRERVPVVGLITGTVLAGVGLALALR